MEQSSEDPQELFGLRVAHVGINAADEAEARSVAERFSTLMGLPAASTPVSIFSGSVVETMAGAGRGTHGHIGFHVDDLPAAEEWFSERGFAIDEDSRALNPDGTTRLVYFQEPIAGFAIHLTQD